MAFVMRFLDLQKSAGRQRRQLVFEQVEDLLQDKDRRIELSVKFRAPGARICFGCQGMRRGISRISRALPIETVPSAPTIPTVPADDSA